MMQAPLSILAQQLPLGDPSITVVIVINVLIVLLLVLVAWKNLTRKETALPQPMVTQKHAEYVPRHEFTRLEAQVNMIGHRVEVIHQDLLHAGEERAVKIHERLNLLIEQHGEIRGRLQTLTDQNKPIRPR